MIVIGYHAVEALLSSEHPIRAVHCLERKDSNRSGAIRDLLAKKKVALRSYPEKDKNRFEAEFKRVGGTNEELLSAQGIFAEIGEIKPVPHLELLRKAKEQEKFPLIIYLDSVTDPQNLGSILRSAAAFGVRGLVLTESRASPLTPAAIKISSGGFIHVPISRVPNLARALDEAKEEGFWIVGLSEHASKGIDSARFDAPMGLIIGNEEKGMRQLTEKNCDYFLSLPTSGAMISLNAATAAAVAMVLVREKQK
jgi:23S rRNA (guanosine2251-2'-O)-methyltransferase